MALACFGIAWSFMCILDGEVHLILKVGCAVEMCQWFLFFFSVNNISLEFEWI